MQNQINVCYCPMGFFTQILLGWLVICLHDELRTYGGLLFVMAGLPSMVSLWSSVGCRSR